MVHELQLHELHEQKKRKIFKIVGKGINTSHNQRNKIMKTKKKGPGEYKPK